MNLAAKRVLAAALAVGIAAPATCFATNGMFLTGIGTKSRGMGGVAIAMPVDSLAGAVNPATIRDVDNRIDVGADIFNPEAEISLGIGTAKEVTQTSRANMFLIPHMGGVMKFNRDLTFGMTAVGVGGGGSRFRTNVYNFQNAGANNKQTLGVQLLTMQINPTAAYKINSKHTVGASLIIAAQQFRAFGLQEFAQFTSGQNLLHLTNRGNDYAVGGGLRIGWYGQFLKKRLAVGAVATSRVYMSHFDKYDELFADSGNMDTPENYGIGASFKINKQLTVAMDVTHTRYQDTAAIGNRGPNTGEGEPFPESRDANALGEDEGLGFGWDNQTVYKLGLEYQHDKKWTFRGGWNYGRSPIPEEESILFNLLAPASTQHHAHLGFTYRYSRSSEISVSLVHAFEFKQSGPTYIGVYGELAMEQDSLGASFGWRF